MHNIRALIFLLICGIPLLAAAAADDLRKLSAKALKGDAAAQLNLGAQYAQGRGVAKNDAEALTWYLKSARQK